MKKKKASHRDIWFKNIKFFSRAIKETHAIEAGELSMMEYSIHGALIPCSFKELLLLCAL